MSSQSDLCDQALIKSLDTSFREVPLYSHIVPTKVSAVSFHWRGQLEALWVASVHVIIILGQRTALNHHQVTEYPGFVPRNSATVLQVSWLTSWGMKVKKLPLTCRERESVEEESISWGQNPLFFRPWIEWAVILSQGLESHMECRSLKTSVHLF